MSNYQWCVICGEKFNAAGQCPDCTPAPRAATPEGDAAELQARLDTMTANFNTVTDEFNKANGNLDATRKELHALKQTDANKCLACDGTACEGCKKAHDHARELGAKVDEFEEMVAGNSGLADVVTELKAELEKERSRARSLDAKLETANSTVSKLEGELAKLSAKDADTGQADLGLDTEKPTTTKKGGKKPAKKAAPEKDGEA